MSEAHSRPGGGSGRDLSVHRKKPTERSSLTSWRWQREGLVGTRKETNRATQTHHLEMAEVLMTWKETDRARRTHSLKAAEGGIRQDMERNRPSGETHSLEMAEGRTCQDTEKNRLSEAHSRPGGGSRRDLSGHRMKPTERGALTFWR